MSVQVRSPGQKRFEAELRKQGHVRMPKPHLHTKMHASAKWQKYAPEAVTKPQVPHGR